MMRLENLPPNISEDIVIRLRAKMEDQSFKRIDEKGSSHVVLRVPGESIDLLRSLEYLAEFVGEEMIEGIGLILIISDREVEIADGSIMIDKIAQKKADDQRLYSEIKERVKPGGPPLVFTMENDILELYRIAIRAKGRVVDNERSSIVEMGSSDLPNEGAVVYLLYDDGFKKMDRRSFEKEVSEALSHVQVQPRVAKDVPEKAWPRNEIRPFDRAGQRQEKAPRSEPVLLRFDRIRRMGDKAFAREVIRGLGSLGYREDSRFSRPDVNQYLLIRMSGPTVLFKVAVNDEDLSPFFRVLEHRRDVMGILASDVWNPAVQALSPSMGFHYLTGDMTGYIREIVKAVLEGYRT
ncbi:MAG: hypothetical protein QCI82_03335 [Candidatus Thermoplasmatota archaeon]|nr:hypothetical protein [Candidatus Thermoplasmatota archaeon]